MAKSFLTPINLNKQTIIAAAIESLGTAPSSPAVGQLYYDTVDGALKYRNASAWVTMDPAKVPDGYIPIAKLNSAVITGISVTAPLTTTGTATPTLGISAATTGAAGSMSSGDKSKLDGIAASATNTPLSSTLPAAIGTAAIGVGTTVARADHVHAHGNQAGGTLHADVIAAGASGFMSGSDKTKLDGVASGATANSTDATLLARANHTGTQAASTISNFDTQVRTSSLNQMTAPTAAVSMNSQKITNLGAPTAASNDAARIVDVENAVQSAAAGIDAKPSVRVASTANLGLTGLTAIDGVTPIAGDRILAKNQTTPAANGVYVAAAGSWVRAGPEDQNNEMTPGAFWFVEEGTTQGKTQWRIENTGTITLGTTAITINQFGAASSYSAGDGLLLTGSVFSVKVPALGGILEDSTGIYLDPAVAVRKYAAAVGDASATVFVLTHNLNTRDVTVGVYLNSGSYEEVEADVEHTTVNTVTLRFATAPAASAYRAVIHG